MQKKKVCYTKLRARGASLSVWLFFDVTAQRIICAFYQSFFLAFNDRTKYRSTIIYGIAKNMWHPHHPRIKLSFAV
jgi:hypothetical protein